MGNLHHSISKTSKRKQENVGPVEDRLPIIHKKPQAELDLLDIWDYIAVESFERADQFLDVLNEKLEMLANNPKLGRVRDELSLGLRSFPVRNHIIFNRPIAQGIDVIRILNSARDKKRYDNLSFI